MKYREACIIKLMNGEEVICVVSGKNLESKSMPGKKCILIKYPLLVMPNSETQQIILAPWSSLTLNFSKDIDIEIDYDKVVICEVAPKEISEDYLKKVNGDEIEND